MATGILDMDHEDLSNTGIVGGIVTVLGALGTGIWFVVNKVRGSRRQDDKTAIGYYRAIIDKLDQKSDLLSKQNQDLQAALSILQQRCNDCDIDNESLHGWVERKYEEACDNYESAICMIDLLESMGHKVPLKPKRPSHPPERRNRDAQDRLDDYQRRIKAQKDTTLSELDSKIKSMQSDFDSHNA